MAVSAPWSKCLALATGVLVVLGFPAASAPSQTAGNAAAKVLTVRIVNQGALDEDGPPWGSVRSTPQGIDCPPACDASFEIGTQVRLVATPAEGYALSSWNALPNAESCKEAGPCSLTIDSSSLIPSVEAFFVARGRAPRGDRWSRNARDLARAARRKRRLPGRGSV